MFYAFEVFLFIGYLIEGRNKKNCLKIFCLISNTRKNLDQFKSGKCKLKCGISERIQFNEFQILANKSKVNKDPFYYLSQKLPS